MESRTNLYQSVKFAKEGDTLLPHVFTEMFRALHHILPLNVKSVVRRGIVCLTVIIGELLLPTFWTSYFLIPFPSQSQVVPQPQFPGQFQVVPQP